MAYAPGIKAALQHGYGEQPVDLDSDEEEGELGMEEEIKRQQEAGKGIKLSEAELEKMKK